MRILTILAVATALGASTLVPPALAANAKGYPGATCETADRGARSQFTLNANGTIFNPGNTALRLICPGVKDCASIDAATVRVIDRTVQGEVACTLSTLGPSGSVVKSETKGSGMGFADTNPRALSFGDHGPSGGGYYSLECVVPPVAAGNSGIVMYQISEDNQC